MSKPGLREEQPIQSQAAWKWQNLTLSLGLSAAYFMLLAIIVPVPLLDLVPPLPLPDIRPAAVASTNRSLTEPQKLSKLVHPSRVNKNSAKTI